MFMGQKVPIERPPVRTIDDQEVRLGRFDPTSRPLLEARWPLAASFFAEPELLRAHQEEAPKTQRGSPSITSRSGSCLRAEQRLGWVDKHVNPKVVYALLFGACLHRVFLSHFLGQSFGPSDEMFIKEAVGAAFAGMRPASGDGNSSNE